MSTRLPAMMAGLGRRQPQIQVDYVSLLRPWIIMQLLRPMSLEMRIYLAIDIDCLSER